MVWLKKSGSGWKLHFYSGGRIQYPLDIGGKLGFQTTFPISNYERRQPLIQFDLSPSSQPAVSPADPSWPTSTRSCLLKEQWSVQSLFYHAYATSWPRWLYLFSRIWTHERKGGSLDDIATSKSGDYRTRNTRVSLSLSLTSDKLPNGDHVTCLSPIPPYSSSSIIATAVELTMQVIVIAMCTREKVVHPNPKISKRIIWNLLDRGWKRAELRQFWWNWKEITSSLGGYRFWIYIFERLFL